MSKWGQGRVTTGYKKSENRIVRAFLGYRDVLVRALLRWSVDPNDVDDVLQEALRRTLEAENAGKIDFPKSYLFTVSRNVVFREHERRSREVQTEIDDASLPSSDASVEDHLHYRRMLEVFRDALDSLPEKQRRAILLRRVYGLSHRQIARKMGVSVSSVEKYFAQGIARCQDLLVKRGYALESFANQKDKRPMGEGTTPTRNTSMKDRSHER